MLCVHCNSTARFTSKGGKALCQPHAQQCPQVKSVNSARLKSAHERKAQAGVKWRELTDEARASHAWCKGKTAETNPSLKAMQTALTGRRRLTDELEFARRQYYESCEFDLSLCDITSIRGYELLKRFGMYHITKNPNGVVRDHRLSRAYGFEHSIDPQILAHPANCAAVLRA